METYEVMLGVDRAARDTGVRITLMVRESNPLIAAIKAEQIADGRLPHPEVEYTHAMRVRPVVRKAAVAQAMTLPMAA